MVFNSIPFFLFFIVVFFIYWFPLKNTTKGQNAFLLLASWFFYGYADWRMLPLMVMATVVFFLLGKVIYKAKTAKASNWLAFLGVALGVGTLLYFKYFNFFIESFSNLFHACGLQTNLHTFNIIMPLGISFFTFKLIGYVVEIHRGKIEPTRDFVEFATYIAFFPCILSGPIDRPQFINQLKAKRIFDYDIAVDGMRQILWGLFKKVVVADNCATYVDEIWSSVGSHSGSTLLLAAVLYLFQIYADFSGYSDMAIGVGKLLGFRIADNFKTPLFALNIADYWRRWHITLTQWLTDYVFMPLNVRLRNWDKWGMAVSIVVTFLLIGLWHGANWTFVVFGLYHGLLYIPLIVSGTFMKKAKLKTNQLGLPVLKDFGRMLLTFMLVTIGLIIFRAESIGQAWEYICRMMQLGTLRASYRFFTWPGTWPANMFIVFLLVVEWLQRGKKHALDFVNRKNHIWWHMLVYITIALCVEYYFILSIETPSTFIYFQF